MVISKNVLWGLVAVGAGACVAAAFLPQSRWPRRRQGEDLSSRVDEASEDSFPASDPPSFSAPSTAVPGPTS